MFITSHYMIVVGFGHLLLAALWTLGCCEVQEAKEGGRALSRGRGPVSIGDPSPGTPPLHSHLTIPHRDWFCTTSYFCCSSRKEQGSHFTGKAMEAQRPNDLPKGMHLENSHIEG